MFTDFETDDSSVHIACTQEGCADVDVVWDWNSPQGKRQKQTLQRRVMSRSPKIPLKRRPSNNHVQNFEKLREELQNLRQEISVPDSEESLVLSPLEEAEYKDISNSQKQKFLTPSYENCLIQEDEDLFNDSADEQLVLFSQKIEMDLYNTGHIKTHFSCDSDRKLTDIKNTIQALPISVSNSNSVKVNKLERIHSDVSEKLNIADDSFDTILEKIKVEPPEEFTKVSDKIHTKDTTANSSHKFPRTKSENQYQVVKKTTGKVEFYRTQSFESTFEFAKDIIPQSKLNEIERKRKEALAKLEMKRKQEYNYSPMKCTPEEIEHKRLQALAKRETKRQQDVIERKRQEALKRLELRRKKNATVVKSSLTKRL